MYHCNTFDECELSNLFLTLCIRRRKAQMELCFALDRKNSAYLLENSISPSCLLRPRPAVSSCLKYKNHINMDLHVHINIRFVICFNGFDLWSLWEWNYSGNKLSRLQVLLLFVVFFFWCKLTWVWPQAKHLQMLALTETTESPHVWSKPGNSPSHLRPWGHDRTTHNIKTNAPSNIW